jgi:predicted kinase/phosphopantetheine adenylyltransferase
MKSFLELIEESEKNDKHAVMAFGRMNPPTTGHMKVIDKVKEVAHKVGGTHHIIVSHSQDSKKNPLSGEQKVKHLKRYSPGTNITTSSKEHPTFLHHAAELHKKGVTHLHMVAGSDRVKEYKEKLHQYNGTHKGALYNFKKIHVHSSGERDPDAEGDTGMSGTKMREHAKNNDLHSFRKGVPSHVSDHHVKELMHDVRKGMGLHESVNHGQFKAVFVTGGPGSGKDIIIRESIPEANIVELNFIQARDYLADKQKLSEKTNDYRREAIRNRVPLIINGPADDFEKISYIKEELEELGYETLMVFVNTTNEVSQERNTLLSRMMLESVRQEKWLKAQNNNKQFTSMFENFITFDNTGNLDTKEEDINEVYQSTASFLDKKVINETALDWLDRHNQFDINHKFNLLFKEERNVKKDSKSIQKATISKYNPSFGAEGPGDITPDNRAGDPNADNIKWDGNKKRGSYTFRTYSEAKSEATLKVTTQAKEPNFQKDNDKNKKLKRGDASPYNSKPDGLSSEWNTRTNGSGLTGGAGLGNQTYSECACQDYSNANPASTAIPSGGSPNPLSGDFTAKSFNKFRNKLKKEAIDDPGSNEMGVGGTLGGSTNKEGMDTYKDELRNIGIKIKEKKKKGEK